MPSMRDIKRRIRSIKSTQQITKAMKMVAAAKLRKSQEKVVAARPYADQLQEVMRRLVASVEAEKHPLLEVRERRKVAYAVFGGDRGFCGGYNTNVIRLAERTAREESAASTMVVLGRKSRDYFRRRNFSLLQEYVDLGDDINYIQAREVARNLVELYTSGQVDEVNLVYTRFYSPIRQQPILIKILPVTPPEEKQGGAEEDYLYEPPAEEVLQSLLPRYVETVIYRALLEAKASEFGARMTAMAAATDNAEEIINKLTLFYNRARQAAITKEILEVVNGAEALK